jgi:hypothetical protein
VLAAGQARGQRQPQPQRGVDEERDPAREAEGGARAGRRRPAAGQARLGVHQQRGRRVEQQLGGRAQELLAGEGTAGEERRQPGEQRTGHEGQERRPPARQAGPQPRPEEQHGQPAEGRQREVGQRHGQAEGARAERHTQQREPEQLACAASAGVGLSGRLRLAFHDGC